ncbi:hypothetical protein [Sporosarcina sp. SAFN-015]|uniref:hypothetical protein n=1 Tax=Sporosarcina sp. SAFN-015 TaxID=3387274 RepID=UPI003F7F989C
MKLSYKVLSTAFVAALATASIVAPAPSSAAEASVDQIVVKMGEKNYSISLIDYAIAQYKGPGDQLYDFIADGSVSAIASESKYISLIDYAIAVYQNDGNTSAAIEDAAAISNETLSTFELFKGFDEEGKPITEEIVGDKAFEVLSISAVTKSSITVKSDAPPSSTPTAKQFNVTVGGEKVEVAKVSEQTDGSLLLEVDLTGKRGTLVVNEVTFEDYIVDYLTKLSVYVGNNHVLTVSNGLSTSLSEVKGIYAEILKPALEFFVLQGLSVDASFITDVETAVKKEITELTGETVMSNVRLADLDGKTISITLTGYEAENPENVKTYDFEISFQSQLD